MIIIQKVKVKNYECAFIRGKLEQRREERDKRITEF